MDPEQEAKFQDGLNKLDEIFLREFKDSPEELSAADMQPLPCGSRSAAAAADGKAGKKLGECTNFYVLYQADTFVNVVNCMTPDTLSRQVWIMVLLLSMEERKVLALLQMCFFSTECDVCCGWRHWSVAVACFILFSCYVALI